MNSERCFSVVLKVVVMLLDKFKDALLKLCTGYLCNVLARIYLIVICFACKWLNLICFSIFLHFWYDFTDIVEFITIVFDYHAFVGDVFDSCNRQTNIETLFQV